MLGKLPGGDRNPEEKRSPGSGLEKDRKGKHMDPKEPGESRRTKGRKAEEKGAMSNE